MSAGKMRRNQRRRTFIPRSVLPADQKLTPTRQTLCNCLNSRETLCKARCPNYTPIYRVSFRSHTSHESINPNSTPQPCPVSISSPTPIPTPTPTPTPLCECEQIFCIQAWPQSCYCANAGKEACYKKCGGPKPSLQVTPPSLSCTLPH